MGMSFTKYVENTFNDQITEAAEAVVRETNKEDIPVEVIRVVVWQIDLNRLYSFEDYAELPVIIAVTVKSSEDCSDYYRKLYMRGMISGTFSEGLNDFSITLTEVLMHEPRKTAQKVTDDLLLKSHTKEFEDQIHAMLDKAYRYIDVHTLPHEIDPVLIAKKHGFSVQYAPLGPKNEVRGAFTLTETTVNLYDTETGSYYPSHIDAKTIIVNKALYGNWEVVRFTVAHELVHAVPQRFAFWFKRICDKIDSPFCCPTRSFEDYHFLDDFVERTERQADYGASLELMPRAAFQMKAEEILKTYGENPDPYDLRNVIEETAAFFVVSASAAKRTFIELEYEWSAGVLNFIDGAYVPPFAYTKGSLAKDETYVISAAQLRTILEKDRKLAKHIAKGRLCFIENHLIINSPEFIKGHAGGKKLTWTARTHMDKCAVKFKLIFADSRVQYGTNLRYRTSDSDIAYRSPYSYMPVSVIAMDTALSIEERAARINERSADVTEITKQIGKDFPKSLDAVIKWSEMENKDIAEAAWVNPKTLYLLRTSDEESPSLQVIIRLCVAMKLPTEVSYCLIESSGCGKRANLKDMGFVQYLEAPGLFTVELINQLQKAAGRPTLGGVNPAA